MAVIDPSAHRFEIEPRERVGEVRLVLRGELDIAGAPRFELELDAALARNAGGGVVVCIDLRGLTFLDSVGLRAIIDGQRRAQRAGHRLSVIPVPAHVQRLFEVTRTAELLEFQDGSGAS